MTVPTRIIDEPTFRELAKAEGDMVVLYHLINVPFNPPLPEGETRPKVKKIAMNILLMNVTEPLIYKDKQANKAFIIINGYNQDETFTYENFNDIHLVKNSWGYRLAPSYWSETDETDDLEEAIYVFKHSEREGQGDDEV